MSFGQKLKTLEKLAELGREDRVMDQTITQLLDYATERHRTDLEAVEAKLRALEEQFGMTSVGLEKARGQVRHQHRIGDQDTIRAL